MELVGGTVFEFCQFVFVSQEVDNGGERFAIEVGDSLGEGGAFRLGVCFFLLFSFFCFICLDFGNAEGIFWVVPQ